MNYPEFVAALAKPLPTQPERIQHALFGVIGELGELVDAYKKHVIYGKPLDRTNVIEELGDMRFYIQMLLNENIEPDQIDQCTNELKNADNFGDLLTECSVYIGELSGAYLWTVRYSEPLGMTIATWEQLCYLQNIEPNEVIIINMEKLSKRYPNLSYSNEHAIQRLDKAE